MLCLSILYLRIICLKDEKADIERCKVFLGDAYILPSTELGH